MDLGLLSFLIKAYVVFLSVIGATIAVLLLMTAFWTFNYAFLLVYPIIIGGALFFLKRVPA